MIAFLSDTDSRAAWRSPSWLLAIGASTMLLLLPAVYNRFPLIFPDTDIYLDIAYGRTWSVDRSGFYGLILKPIVSPTATGVGLWLVIVVQVALVATILTAIVRKLVPSATLLAVVAMTAGLGLLTSLPWHAGQLMPDAFAGPIILIAWLVASRDVGARGSPLLWLAITALMLLHYTYVGLAAVTVAVTLVLRGLLDTSWREIGKRAIAALIAISAVLAAQITVNGVQFSRWTVSPMGSWFLFARLHEDGLTGRWLERHCGQSAPKPLCDIRQSMPEDSQNLLWWTESPLTRHIQEKVGEPEFWSWIDMLQTAVIGSIRDEPVAFLTASIKSTASQFVSFGSVDDQCPRQCQSPRLFEQRPDVTAPLLASRQLQDQIPKRAIRIVAGTVAAFGLLLLLPITWRAWRRGDIEALTLLTAVAFGLLANAAVTGALSDVQERYQSRVVWLAPMLCLVVLMRWRTSTPIVGATKFSSSTE